MVSSPQTSTINGQVVLDYRTSTVLTKNGIQAQAQNPQNAMATILLYVRKEADIPKNVEVWHPKN
jgi:hypothetical protein